MTGDCCLLVTPGVKSPNPLGHAHVGGLVIKLNLSSNDHSG